MSEVNYEDLAELLEQRAVENVRLEFKREAPKKDTMLKVLSAFANTFGGYLVVGATAASDDGRLTELNGIEPQRNYKQTIVQWCTEGVYPPLTVEVSDAIQVSASEDRFAYVIQVQESDVAPHFLNGRKGVWVRTDEFRHDWSQLAGERDLRYLFDRRKEALDRRTFLIGRAHQRYVTSGGAIGGSTPYIELAVVPRFPVRQIAEPGQVRDLLLNTIPWRHSEFPLNVTSLLSHHESWLVTKATGSVSMVEANLWGLLFYATTDHREARPSEARHLRRDHFVGSILVFVHHAAKMLNAMGYCGSIHVGVALRQIRHAKWIWADFEPDVDEGRGADFDDAADLQIDTTADRLFAEPDALAGEILRNIFMATNWWEAVATPDAIKRLIRIGRRYNRWSESHSSPYMR